MTSTTGSAGPAGTRAARCASCTESTPGRFAYFRDVLVPQRDIAAAAVFRVPVTGGKPKLFADGA